ncbi:virion structural protein [Pseudomonas phage PA1C]|uniref:Virion structural protein n=1 Tax=Pseudomonas phage vB_PaeM_PS119XW TaxID=2601632 RepID=A0A5C1K6W7_9CAUD|nr:internal head protein [Pseudomonas phage vB_PaeM_PS119XW]QBX32250.1 virion structural protein [Pseudomonas phage PA1C]QEM41827.1 hypothetical protein [Pseudomonas phage vB_PaeM_PS119XW]
MVDSVNHSQPNAVDGVTPVDLSVSIEDEFNEFDACAEKLDKLMMGMETIERLDTFIQSNYDTASPEMLAYAVEKFGLTDVVSTEDISDSSRQVWERTKLEIKRANSDLYGYAKVLMAGIDRTVERITMLYEMASNLNGTKPFKSEIELRKAKKFNINGEFKPLDIRPVLEQTQNTIDFYDKVFMPYLTAIDKTFNNLTLDQEWTDDSTIRFEIFNAKRWMKGAIEVDQDDRFRVNATLFRSELTQGNKALYFSGPSETKTEQLKDWQFMVNSIRDFRFKYYTVPEQKPLNEQDNKVEVSNINAVRQRLGVLLGLAKRLQSRKGYDQKISAQLRKLEQSAEKIRVKAGQLRQSQGRKKPGAEERDEARPSVSNVVNDLTMILNNVMRMIIDYNNTLAGMIRLIAGLAMVADLELKAYQAPLRKPTEEEQKRLG